MSTPPAVDDESEDEDYVWVDPDYSTYVAVYGRSFLASNDHAWRFDSADSEDAMYGFPAGAPAGRIPCFDCDCTGWVCGPRFFDEACNTCKGTGRVWVGL